MKKSRLLISPNRIIFLFSFGFSKGITFLAPIILADILVKEDFGILEYTLAGVGMLVNSIIDLGASGGYPYFVLKKKDKETARGFVLHGVWLNLFFLIIQLVFFLKLISFELHLAFTMSYIIANQLFYASKLKTYDKINSSVVVNSGIYLVLFIFIIAASTKVLEVNVQTIARGIFGYAGLIFIFNTVQFFKADKTSLIKAYTKILKVSIHIMISAILLFAMSVSGRILVEYFFDFNTVAVYGFYFRLAAISVLIYQVVAIMYFTKIYASAPKILDRYFSYFFLLLLVLSFIVDLAIPYIAPHFSEFYLQTYETNNVLFKILIFQMLMWIATALNSNIIDREKLSRQNNVRLLILYFIGLVILFYSQKSLTVEKLAFILYSLFFLTALIQYFTLSFKGIKFVKSAIVISAIYVISIAYIFLR